MIELEDKFIEPLSQKLRLLSRGDKEAFRPHKFDIRTITKLSTEKGNHYYIYLDEYSEFCGYGMLRTFDQYTIPTLGCVIWQEYRGRGNGRRLLDELIEKAQELHYHKIRLKVSVDNIIAYKLYKEVGFKRMGERQDWQTWMEYSVEENTDKC